MMGTHAIHPYIRIVMYLYINTPFRSRPGLDAPDHRLGVVVVRVVVLRLRLLLRLGGPEEGLQRHRLPQELRPVRVVCFAMGVLVD